MISHSFYESDNRVIRYAETLAERGDNVEVIALRCDPGLPRHEVMNGVRVCRIQDRFGKREESKGDYLWPLLRFLTVSSLWMFRQHRKKKFDLVHVHNIPDFLVFAAWYPKLRGAKVVLDIHDIVPEFFSSKFGVAKRSLLVSGLIAAEKLSAAMADRVILANDLWLEKYTMRSAAREKCAVLINHVDERIFHPQLRTEKSGAPVNSRGPVVMFPGGLQWHQGLDIAIRAFAKLRKRLPEAEFHIYGDGNMKPQLVALVEELELSKSVRFFSPLPIREIAAVMGRADLGVVPKRADSFGNEAYSTKIMEFMAVGVPVVVSSTRIDRHYFDDSVVRFFESGNDKAMADAMFELLCNQELRRNMIQRAREYVSQNSWECCHRRYLQLIDSLIA